MRGRLPAPGPRRLADPRGLSIATDWIGTDPYEGPDAIRLVGPLRRSFRGRQLIIQSVALAGRPRRPSGSSPAEPATLASVASCYARSDLLNEEESERKLRRTLDSLKQLRCGGFEEPCWGLSLRHAIARLLLRGRAPNTIATAFVAQALLDAFDRTGEEWMLEEAAGASRFFLRHIAQTKADRVRTSATSSEIAARSRTRTPMSARCWRDSRATSMSDSCGERRKESSMPCRASDPTAPGCTESWSDLAWVDGDHHGYVLDALRVCDDAGLDDRLAGAIERGLRYYERELLLPDGTPKYFSHNAYPIDSQSCAQAIQTFSIAATRDPSYIGPAHRVFDWTMSNMRRSDGLFMFQRRRRWSNPLPHMRWVVAALLLALTHMSNAERMLAEPSETRPGWFS